jgi:hypothetical protein
LTCNTTVVGNTQGQANNFVVYPCGGGSETGPELVYYLTLDSVTSIQARIVNYTRSGNGSPDVFLLSEYASAACIPGGYGEGSSSSWASYTDAPAGIAYVVVDGWQGWQEQFSLEVACQAEGTATPTPTQTASTPLPVRIALPIILSSFYQ